MDEPVACPLCGYKGVMDDFDFIDRRFDDGIWEFNDTGEGRGVELDTPPRKEPALYCNWCRRMFDYDDLVHFLNGGEKVQRTLFQEETNQ